MGLKKYEVVTEGRHPHTTTLMLSDEDAKRLGVFDKPAKKAAPKKAATPHKARTPRNKAAKPAANKTAPAPATVEDASDPGASE